MPELDIVDLNTITSESSGGVSGLTSSPSTSSIHSTRADMEEPGDRPATITYDRLKSALVSSQFVHNIILVSLSHLLCPLFDP